MPQWQQEEFKINRPAVIGGAAQPGDKPRGLGGYGGDVTVDFAPLRRRPQRTKGPPLQILPEQGGATRSGEPECRTRYRINAEDERIRQDVADCAGLDVAAFRCRALATQAVPI